MTARFLKGFVLAASVIMAIGWQTQAKPSRYLYVWAGTGNQTRKGVNSLVVIDVDPQGKATPHGAVSVP